MKRVFQLQRIIVCVFASPYTYAVDYPTQATCSHNCTKNVEKGSNQRAYFLAIMMKEVTDLRAEPRTPSHFKVKVKPSGPRKIISEDTSRVWMRAPLEDLNPSP